MNKKGVRMNYRQQGICTKCGQPKFLKIILDDSGWQEICDSCYIELKKENLFVNIYK